MAKQKGQAGEAPPAQDTRLAVLSKTFEAKAPLHRFEKGFDPPAAFPHTRQVLAAELAQFLGQS